MREILFRGKRVDNGEWVYGFYGHKPNGNEVEEHFIMEWRLNTASDSIYTYFRDVPVIPETVGQYTGLKDKDGQRVFEGDVVEFEHGGRVRAYVIYKDGSFEVKNDKADVLLYLYVIDHKAEVIGNIHDNPEVTE